jgi:hypothetical protein
MKSEDKKMAFDSIVKLKDAMEKHIKVLGEKKFENLLIENFALSRKSSSSFTQIIEDMIPGVHHDALPLDWFFQEKFRMSKNIKDHIPDMRREYPEIRYVVQKFRKLPDKLQQQLIEYWPEKYRDLILKKFISTSNRSVHEYKTSEVAKEILANRYFTTFETINTYLKNV